MEPTSTSVLDHSCVCMPCSTTTHHRLDTDNATTTTIPKDSSRTKRQRTESKTVRFATSLEETRLIESRSELSAKQMRKTWWTGYQMDDMKPDRYTMECLHQNCSSKHCMRGLEISYWTSQAYDSMPLLEDGETKETTEFLKFVSEFVPPRRPGIQSKSSSNQQRTTTHCVEGSKQDLAVYHHYVRKSEERARMWARLDESYVLEHVHGVSCRRVGHDDDIKQWEHIQCCSCNSYEEGQKLSSSSYATSSTRGCSGKQGIFKNLFRRFRRVGRKVGAF